ncbi:hypothetical protein FOC4_g10005370 [Fusarium odoratissimum]|uniref:Uncharacterized protein n=1 Tax=Fusarium oxysporum f. sp. cubense (strain race 4) TaxID=2502994 RepID=N1RL63_FUSC4|nr:hypothetical protein FOC4_g10005370 [Fusarium odoratissimum]
MASTTHASLKRTRSTASLNDAALDVLCSIAAKSRKIQSLGSNIRRLAAKLTHRARCATSRDLDDLKDSWEALSLLIESKYEVKGLKGRLNTQRAHINKVHFDLHIGDWAMDIHNRVKAGERKFAREYAKDLEARQRSSLLRSGTLRVKQQNPLQHHIWIGWRCFAVVSESKGKHISTSCILAIHAMKQHITLHRVSRTTWTKMETSTGLVSKGLVEIERPASEGSSRRAKLPKPNSKPSGTLSIHGTTSKSAVIIQMEPSIWRTEWMMLSGKFERK